MPEHVDMSITLPVELARRVDLLAAHIREASGPVCRSSRSAAVRVVLEQHLAAAPAVPCHLAPRPVRVRKRKPARES
jgi:hypothetical protein